MQRKIYTIIRICWSLETRRLWIASTLIHSTLSLRFLCACFISLRIGKVFRLYALIRPSLKSSLISPSLSERSIILWRERSSEMMKLMKFTSQNISRTISSPILSLAHQSRMTSTFSPFQLLASRIA